MLETAGPSAVEMGASVFPMQFRYQRGEEFQFFVDKGIASKLDSSAMCWLACIDMVSSTTITDGTRRLALLEDIASTAQQFGMVDEAGGLLIGEDPTTYMTLVNRLYNTHDIPMRVFLKQLTHVRDIGDELKQGNFVQITAGFPSETGVVGGHAVLMDKVFTDLDKTEEIFRFWDPLAPNAAFGQNYVSTSQPVFLMDGKPAVVDKRLLVYERTDKKAA